MKKHLSIEVTGKSAISPQQFPADHETPLEDIGFKRLYPMDEKDIRRFHGFESLDEVRKIPHDQIRAGQSVVSTQRVHDMMANHPGGMGQAKQLPNGDYVMEDGHHRLAADRLSGKTATTVRVTGRYKPNPYGRTVY